MSGTVVPAGNKNAALPLLAACLLTDEPVVLHNVPRIRDTEALLVLLEDLGVTVERREGNTLVLQADGVTKTEVDEIDRWCGVRSSLHARLACRARRHDDSLIPEKFQGASAMPRGMRDKRAKSHAQP